MSFTEYEADIVLDVDDDKTPRTSPDWTSKDVIEESSTTRKRKYLGRKIHVSSWDKKFVISCVFAVSLDPLFLYVLITDKDMKCLKLDRKLKTTALVLRSLTDLFYIVDVIQILRRVKFVYPRNRHHFSSTKRIWVIAKRSVNSRMEINILAVLPIPQLVIFIFFTNYTRDSTAFKTRMLLNSLIAFQYVVRIFRIHIGRVVLRSMVISIWVKSLLKFFIFILASHVLGALWYFFSIQREIDCWKNACPSENGCTFDCDNHQTVRNITLLNNLCPINPPNATLFDFGIFLDSLQSGMLESTNFTQKFILCFWWGLRNLSSFGSNLDTSTDQAENLFAVFISIMGILLFLIYLNNVLQKYMRLTTTRLEESRRMRAVRKKRDPEIASWLYENGLSMRWREEIMLYANKGLEPYQEVNLHNILSIVPLEYCRYIKRNLCVRTLKKVPGLQTMDEEKLEEVCDNYLTAVVYMENSYIFREKEPIDKMVFITQGTVRTYTISNISSSTCLTRGDFYGEELINWAGNNVHSPGQIENVKCFTEEDHEANLNLVGKDSKGTLVSETERSRSMEMQRADSGASNKVGVSVSTQEDDVALNLMDKKTKGIAYEKSPSVKMDRADSGASNKVGISISTQNVNLSTEDDEASNHMDKKLKGIAYERSRSVKMDRADSRASNKVGISISTQEDDEALNLMNKKMKAISCEMSRSVKMDRADSGALASNKVPLSTSTENINLSTEDDESLNLKDKYMKSIAYERSGSVKMDRADSGASNKVGLSISTQNVNLSTEDEEALNLKDKKIRGITYEGSPSVPNRMVSTYSDLPISTRSVKCSTKVEAFILMPNALKDIVSEKSHLIRRFTGDDTPYYTI